MVPLLCLLWLVPSAPAGEKTGPPAEEPTPESAVIRALREGLGLSEAQLAEVRTLLEASDRMGQGRVPPTEHPMDLASCHTRAEAAGHSFRVPEHEAICGGLYMAPLYDPATQSPAEAGACIDVFEFPGTPCTFPLVWVRASEAAQLCEAVGKRLCDAHEWEGACAGRLQPPDYRFDLAEGRSPAEAQRAMRDAHNLEAEKDKRWAHGQQGWVDGLCAGGSHKSPGCDGSDWRRCGSNTYPTGAFPQCRSPLGVYDLHGNAAEHMNLPLSPEQLASTGAQELGLTEMKGSWFIWDHYEAHPDWCRWRAPYWHGGPVQAEDSHRNYHLGFRCCATLDRP